ncbi:MAG: 2-oxoglutarate dehydrogenase, E2 component, dihydrolipoamide succinyltransferase [Bryobacteraceae bacterium]|jgi:pyruvate dehydrogenase E2 component (dihydrolipoyllysine-residue acetyltransferase)
MTDVVMPQMGESIVEGTLTRWLKKPGEHVERDEPLFEISTDKVDTEIPSPAAGTLSEVLVEEGKTVGISTVVARIAEGGESAQSAAPVAPEALPVAVQAEPKAEPEAAPAPVPTPVPAPVAAPIEEAAEPAGPLSPLVRRMARENSIDLSKVKGTGAGGRITKQDLEAYMAREKQESAPEVVAAPPPPPAMPVEAPAAPVMPPLPVAAQAKARVEPMSTMRIRIAEHMLASRRTSAHVTTIHKVDMTKVARMRDRHKADFQSRYGMSLTYLPFVVRATVVGLRTYPLLNASIEGNNIIHHNEINVGIAVALENGLIVPVIRQADEKNVLGLQRSIVDLATRARSRQLKPDEVQGGTFSITNFGSFGSVIATPIINQPQVAILGVGAVEKAPVVVDDAIAIRSVMYLSLSFDHRLIDGALGDQFTAKVKQVLEHWSEEVL